MPVGHCTRLAPHNARGVPSRPVLPILPDDAYEEAQGYEGEPPAMPTLWQSEDGLTLRFDPAYTPLDRAPEDHREAYGRLEDELSRVSVAVSLSLGEVLVVDNDLVVHGRVPFKARYDGTDRWLKRSSPCVCGAVRPVPPPRSRSTDTARPSTRAPRSATSRPSPPPGPWPAAPGCCSAGGVVYEALTRMTSLAPGTIMVALINDGGEKYLDTVFDDDWMSARELLAPDVEREVDELLPKLRRVAPEAQV